MCWRAFLYGLHVFCTSVSDVPRQFLARLNATKSRLASMTRQYFYCLHSTCKLPRDFNALRNTWRVPKLSTISPVKSKKHFESQKTRLFFLQRKYRGAIKAKRNTSCLPGFISAGWELVLECSKPKHRPAKLKFTEYVISYSTCVFQSCLHKKSNRAYVSTNA